MNVPNPPDYGGMIDSFYRIKSLHELGVQIHLHCFEYGREQSEVLLSLCKSVNYYPRNKGIARQLSIVQFTVLSRKSNALLKNLMEDDHPILFDGLHTTYFLNHPALSGRKKFVRAHNVEHKYYLSLAKNERSILRKIYFLAESFRLKLHEKKLKKADGIFSISAADNEYYSSRYGKSELVFPFVPFTDIICKSGSGNYIIYHGDLTISENAEMCEILEEEVFSKVPFPCIIAGKSPSERLRLRASNYKNITIIPDPDEKKMLELIKEAHINLLPAKSRNGFKLKLLYALFAGRHCLVNNTMVRDTILDSLCHTADDSPATIEKINTLMKQPFTDEMILDRSSILINNFNNSVNAEKIIRLLF